MAAVWNRSHLQNHSQEVGIFVDLRFSAPAQGPLPTYRIAGVATEVGRIQVAGARPKLAFFARPKTKSLFEWIRIVLIPKRSGLGHAMEAS
jgi:hypothetical protein